MKIKTPYISHRVLEVVFNFNDKGNLNFLF